ncbi:CDP-glucose 4,6-dehydratase [Bradyrhizobium diazoefficiens]|uniref:CDP-glucose 4,6-dehydratase n=1 Tax=Bradyrhizobium diazoefficiens TaxID=1355477 RepID=UPI0027296498|nr:CDP-glucose 4,6-dehydratase [Bradyrhizobium diazoefficiens]WLA68044.1 CDP-glucose 4,6-dehydratase [Bradyrhizobium diazoefficiens]
MPQSVLPQFWKDKRVLVTGHTGFKGSWLALWLTQMGAQVSGFARPPATEPNLYTIAALQNLVSPGFGDLQTYAEVEAAVERSAPEIVFHLAAQPLVLRSVREPVETFATNVMGTVNLLAALRKSPRLKVVLVVTTDKVYRNNNAPVPFRESDTLGGHDPYSASKAATELAAAAFATSYFEAQGVSVATARGGNVIGGGDFSEERLVPDIYRAVATNGELVLRHPEAIRPWQHVFDCLCGYLTYAQELHDGKNVPRAINFGPSAGEPIAVATMANAMLEALGRPPRWRADCPVASVEMQHLTLDSRLAHDVLGWSNQLPGMQAIQATADWYLAFRNGADMRAYTLASIEDFLTR